MIKKASYKLVFNRKNKINKDGKSLIQIEVYQNRQRKYISTNVYIKPEHWNENKAQISARHPSYIQLNNMLNEKIMEIEQYELSQLNDGKGFDFSTLDNYLNAEEITNSFLDFYEREMEKDSSIKLSTKKEHKFTLGCLKEFHSEISFDDLTYEFLQNFDYFLRTKNYSQNTIHKHHRHIHRFLNIAIKKELFDMRKNPYLNFKSKKVPSQRLDLSFEELKRIENMTFPEQSKEIEIVRDIFLFSCYSGLRFSDVMNLQQKHVQTDKNEISISLDKVIKTEKPLTLPLFLLFNGKPQVLLLKYISDKIEFIFPKISNQHMNRILKIIAVIGNINKHLSFHIARHTFGTNLAELTADPYLIKELMGHADIKTSMIYIHNSKERINRQLRKVDWKMES